MENRVILKKNSSENYRQIKIKKDPGETKRRLQINPRNQLMVVGNGTDNISYSSQDNGNTWTQVSYMSNNINRDNYFISQNKRYIAYPSQEIGGYYYVMHSSDFGKTFQQKAPSEYQDFGDIHGSLDGKYYIASQGSYYADGGYVYVSRNFGETWTVVQTGPRNGSDMSRDGKYMIFNQGGDYGNNKFSSDYGQTFSDFNPGSGSVTRLDRIETSNDGTLSVITDTIEYIWLTSDFSTFTAHSFFDGSRRRTHDAAISYDGKYILVATSGNTNTPWQFSLSSDYGNTFRQINTTEEYWQACRMSSDGKYMIVVPAYTSSKAFKSVDSGNTWERIDFFPDAGETGTNDCEMTESGKHVIFTSSQGLYISHDYMNTWERIFQGKNMRGTFANY